MPPSFRLSLLLGVFLTGAAGLEARETVKVRVYGTPPPELLESGDAYLLARKGEERLYRLERALYDALPTEVRLRLRGGDDTITLPGLRFDSYHESPLIPGHLADWAPSGPALYVVQFFGGGWSWPVGGVSAGDLRLANGAQLRWTDDLERAELEALVWSPELHATLDYGEDPPPLLQYAGPYHPLFKLHPELTRLAPDEVVEVAVQVYRNPAEEGTMRLIEERARGQTREQSSLHSRLLVVSLRGADVAAVAHRRDVMSIRASSPSERYGPAKETLLVSSSTPLDADPSQAALQWARDGRFYYRVTNAFLAEPTRRERLEWIRDSIELEHLPFDTQDEQVPTALQSPRRGEEHRLHLIQYLPSPSRSWWTRVGEAGDVARGLSGDGRLLWIDGDGVRQLDRYRIPPGLYATPNASDPSRFLRYSDDWHPYFKTALERWSSSAATEVDVVLYRHAELEETEQLVKERSLAPIEIFDPQDERILRAVLRPADLLDVARRRDVIEIASPQRRSDRERRWWTVRARPGTLDANQAGVSLLLETEGWTYYRLSTTVYDALDPALRRSLLVERDVFVLPPGSFGVVLDTQEDPLPQTPSAEYLASGEGLHLVQYLAFAELWQGHIAATGARPVEQVSFSGEILWTDEESREALRDMVLPAGLVAIPDASAPPRILTFSGPYHSELKIGWRLTAFPGRYKLARVSVHRHPEMTATRDLAILLTPSLHSSGGDLRIKSFEGWYDEDALLTLARRPDVLSIVGVEAHNDLTTLRDSLRVIAPPGLLDPDAPGIQLLSEVRGRASYRIADEAVDGMGSAVRRQLELRSNFIELGSYRFDSQDETIDVPPELELVPGEGEALHVIQFADDPPEAWLEELTDVGARVVPWRLRPAANDDALLVWADGEARARLLDWLAPPPFLEVPGSSGPVLIFETPLHPLFRLAWWALEGTPPAWLATGERIWLQVSLAVHPEYNAQTRDILSRATVWAEEFWIDEHVRGFYLDLHAEQVAATALELALRPDVIWVGEPQFLEGPSGFEESPGDGPSGPGSSFDPEEEETLTEIPVLPPAGLALLAALIALVGLRALR